MPYGNVVSCARIEFGRPVAGVSSPMVTNKVSSGATTTESIPWLGLVIASWGEALPSMTVLDLVKLVGFAGGDAVHSSTMPKPVPVTLPLS